MRRQLIPLIFLSFSTFAGAEISAPFFWGGYEDGAVKFEKTSILLSVKGENEGYVQLDTGSALSYAYGENKDKSLTIFSSGGEGFTHIFNPKPELLAGEIVGTLGADFFSSKCLSIDFPREKVLITDCEKERVDPDVVWIDGRRSRFGHLLIDVEVGDHVINNVMFDTGASIFSLVVTENEWKKIVIDGAIENPTHKIVVPSWGKLLTMSGANPKFPVCVESICASKPVYILPKEFGLEDYGISGTIGNALFYDKYMLVMDFRENKIGLTSSGSFQAR